MPKNIKFKLIDNQNRSKLNEGRDYGMGFQFCKRNGTQLIAIQPLSPCKDYLNDVIYSEITGKDFSAHGLNTSKKNLFDHKEAYLVMAICKEGANNGVKYGNYDRDYKTLESNYKNLEKFLNWFEKQLKLKQKTQLIRLKENRVLAILPLFWCEGTYLISLYSLLCRTGFFYKEGNPLEFLKNFEEDDGDRFLLNSCLKKIEIILKGNVPKQNMGNLYNVHNMGIMTFNLNLPVKKENKIPLNLKQVGESIKNYQIVNFGKKN